MILIGGNVSSMFEILTRCNLKVNACMCHIQRTSFPLCATYCAIISGSYVLTLSAQSIGSPSCPCSWPHTSSPAWKSQKCGTEVSHLLATLISVELPGGALLWWSSRKSTSSVSRQPYSNATLRSLEIFTLRQILCFR